MGQLLLVLAAALTVAAVIFGVTVLVTGGDPGLVPAEPDGNAVPLPVNRPLREDDVTRVRFDIALRGYRMSQVDQAISRAAYDIGYKDELIGVLEAEVTALREGRTADADALRDARVAAATATRVADDPAAVHRVTDPPSDPGRVTDPPPADPPPADPLGYADAVTDTTVRDVPAADPFIRPTVELDGSPVRSERS